MDPINEAYQSVTRQASITEAKTDQILKALQKALKYAIADRKEYDGYDVSPTGKKTLEYKWQIELGDKKIEQLHAAIDAYQEYINANEEWQKKGAV